jgi:hypothetical protein
MSKDAFLSAHRLSPGRRIYNISSSIRPVSVRDQMVRAQLLVRHLCLAGELGENDRLLVIGGGVAGVTAALCAQREARHATLIEEKDSLFSTFEDCTTRQIDPYLYEWPSPCWTCEGYSGDVPLLWTAGEPAAIVEDLRRQTAHLHNPAQLTIVYGARRYPDGNLIEGPHDNPTAYNLRITGVQKEADGTLRAVDQTKRFSAIIVAQGQGAENTEAGEFTGLSFWANDTYQEPNLGLPTPPRVLIAGSGDGALQDFIRIVARKHPADLIRAIEKKVGRYSTWQSVCRTLDDVYRSAEKHHHWGRKAQSKDERELCEKLDRAFRKQMRRLEDDLPLWGRIRTAVFPDGVDTDLPQQIILACRGSAFSWGYPLNRFLALLLIRFIGPHRQEVLLKNTQVDRDIRCTHLPDVAVGRCHPCHGLEHHVQLIPLERLRAARDDEKVEVTKRPFDVVIPHFGPSGRVGAAGEDTFLADDFEVDFERHLLPLHPDVDTSLKLAGS